MPRVTSHLPVRLGSAAQPPGSHNIHFIRVIILNSLDSGAGLTCKSDAVCNPRQVVELRASQRGKMYRKMFQADGVARRRPSE